MSWKSALVLTALVAIFIVCFAGQEAEGAGYGKHSYGKSYCRLKRTFKTIHKYIQYDYKWIKCRTSVPVYKCRGECKQKGRYYEDYSKNHKCCSPRRFRKIHYYAKFKCGYYRKIHHVSLKQPTRCRCKYCYSY